MEESPNPILTEEIRKIIATELSRQPVAYLYRNMIVEVLTETS